MQEPKQKTDRLSGFATTKITGLFHKESRMEIFSKTNFENKFQKDKKMAKIYLFVG